MNYITERQYVLGVQGGQSYGVGEAEEVKEKEALSSLKVGLGEAGSWGSGREHRVSKGTEAGQSRPRLEGYGQSHWLESAEWKC